MKYNKNYIYFFMSVICLVLMFVFPEATKETAAESLQVCLFSVIPTLFPFMVITKMILYYYLKIFRVKSNVKKTIYGISKIGVVALILGIISGFPAGAVLSGQMYKKGLLSKKEGETIAVYSSVVSPAFCIVYFGGTILNNKLCGTAIYISVVITTISALLVDNFLKSKNIIPEYNIENTENTNHTDETITGIIIKSFSVVLNICAFVMFFMCLGKMFTITSGFIFPLLHKFDFLIYGILEFSGGISRLSERSFGERYMFGSLIIGFGGFSAIMQVADICTAYGLSYAKLLYTKIFSSILTPIISVFILKFLYYLSTNSEVSYLVTATQVLLSFVVLSLFIGIIIKKHKKIIRKAK